MGHFGKIILLVLSFLSCESFASQADAIQAALQTPAVTSHVPFVTQVDVVNAYHCPDCYDIEISGHDSRGEVAVKVRTESNGYGAMSVKVLEVSLSQISGIDGPLDQ